MADTTPVSQPPLAVSGPAEQAPARAQVAARPVISPRKLAANRANAQRSTGPRTPEGKDTVSQNAVNAVKHGLLASSLQRLLACATPDE